MMYFIDKIKKFFSTQKQKQEPELEKIVFEELNLKIEDKTKEIEEKKKDLNKQIIEKISRFRIDIEKNIINLEKLDLSDRKENYKLKVIVLDNLKIYLNNLKKLILKINEIKETDVKEFIKKIIGVINEFNKLSTPPYEKSTILIGREIAESRELIKKFSDYIKNIVEENKKLFEDSYNLDKIKNNLREFENRRANCSEIKRDIERLKTEIIKDKNESLNMENEIAKIKESEKYKIEKAEKESRKILAEKLEHELQSIKKKLNLRELSKKHHYDKKNNLMISNYNANFKNSLIEDSNLLILELVEDSDKKLFNELSLARKKIIELSVEDFSETERKILSIEENLNKTKNKIKKIEEDIAGLRKKREKLIAKNNNIKQETIQLSNSLFPNFEID